MESPEECLGAEWVVPFIKHCSKKYGLKNETIKPEIAKISEDLGTAILKHNMNGVEKTPYDIIGLIYDDIFSSINEDEDKMEKIVCDILNQWDKKLR